MPPIRYGRVGRLRLGGLRWRLAAWVAGVLIASAAIIFLVVYNSTDSQLNGQVNRDVTGDTNQLAQALGEHRNLLLLQYHRHHPGVVHRLQIKGPISGLANGPGDESVG